ncbi:MAG: hypothetical protein EOO66_29925, partial [Methylobacterium sp.]
MKIFQCQACDQPVSFESTDCESCQRRLGYVGELHEVSALEPVGAHWHAYANPIRKYRFCANAAHGACNWLVPEDMPEAYCTACRHVLGHEPVAGPVRRVGAEPVFPDRIGVG